jgi:hypothetical protein
MPERFFRTARPRGSTYTFDIQFDPHMDANSDENIYRLSLRNTLADEPDFLIDLGDNFMSDKLSPITENAVHDRVKLLRSFYDLTTHSVPLILNLGNHEGEWGPQPERHPERCRRLEHAAPQKVLPEPQTERLLLR